MQRSLSDRDIYNKLRGRTNIWLYSQLSGIRDIDQLFKDNSAVILYENRPRVGHWVCLIRNIVDGRPSIEFFNSYGIVPDMQKKHINRGFLDSSAQKYNKLVELLYRASARYVIHYNNHRLQSRNGNVATCGRHVIARILLKDLDIDSYNRFLRSFGENTDRIVTYISELI
jgi:hypothetical protein